MVNPRFVPYDSLIIHEIIYSKYDDFLFLLQTVKNIDLRWINGVLFFFSGLPAYEYVVEDQKNGIRHWELLHFTKMEKYERVVEIPNNTVVLVTNNNGNNFVSDTIKWLKEQTIWIAN